MRPLDLFLPKGYHYRLRVSDSFFGRDAGIVHVAEGDDAKTIAEQAEQAVCGTKIKSSKGFNRQSLETELARPKKRQSRRSPNEKPQSVCNKCLAYLRERHDLRGDLSDDQVYGVLAVVLNHMAIATPLGNKVRFDPTVAVDASALEDIRKGIVKALGLQTIAADARIGQIVRKAVTRGRRLHPWVDHTVQLAAIESEVAELKEAHDSGDLEAMRAEAIDVVVTAYRYYAGR